MKAKLTFGMTLSGAFLLCTGLLATQYRVVDLGPGHGMAVNEQGQTLISPESAGGIFYLCNKEGVTTSLGGGWSPRSINNLGQVVGELGSSVVLWENGWMRTLAMQSGCAVSDMNDAGRVVGYTASPRYGYSWDPTGGNKTLMADLVPTAVNEVGAVVGYAKGTSVLWRSDLKAFQIVGGHPDYSVYCARDVNCSSVVVGNMGLTYGYWDTPFIWTASSGIQRIQPAGTYDEACVLALNDSDTVVGATYNNIGGYYLYSAFAWAPGLGSTELAPLPGFESSYAVDISNSGIVVGYSQNVGTYQTASRATMWVPVPEPSGLLALLAAIGLTGLRFTVRRK